MTDKLSDLWDFFTSQEEDRSERGWVIIADQKHTYSRATDVYALNYLTVAYSFAPVLEVKYSQWLCAHDIPYSIILSRLNSSFLQTR